MKAEFGILALLLLTSFARAEGEKSNSPYIDKLKNELKSREIPAATSDVPDPYIQSLKKRQAPLAEDSGSYTENLKKRLAPAPPAGTYIENQKAKLGTAPAGGAIAALNEGHSELYARKVGTPSSNFGLRIGATADRSILADGDYAARPFSDVYGTGFAPDITLYFEHQVLKNEPFGSLGIFGSLGVTFFSGGGTFKVQLSNAGGQDSSTLFPVVSNTKFQFFNLPLNIGLVYRMNVWKYVRPFVQLGPTLIGFYEARNDDQPGKWGNTRGYLAVGGIDLLLDWVSAKQDWEAYATNGIHHSYLTVQFSKLGSFGSPVDFEVSGISAGVTFEY